MSDFIYSVTQWEEYRVGQVVRLDNMGAFNDCVIMGFTKPTKYGDVYVKLGRPMVHVTCAGTTGPGVSLSCEEFSCLATKLRFDTLVDKAGHWIHCGPSQVNFSMLFGDPVTEEYVKCIADRVKPKANDDT